MQDSHVHSIGTESSAQVELVPLLELGLGQQGSDLPTRRSAPKKIAFQNSHDKAPVHV